MNTQQTPPRWADRLLEWFVAPHLLEEVQGDLYERFVRDVRAVGNAGANRRYWFNVFRFVRPFAMKRQPTTYSSYYLLSPDMLRNYLKIALRQLWRNRLFAGLNVFGLSIGLSACWVIYRIVSFEFSFDTQNPNRDRIVRVVSRFTFDGIERGNPGTPEPMADAVRRQVAGIERVVPVLGKWMEEVRIPQQTGKPLRFDEVKDVVATDTSYFSLVPYRWLAGNPHRALSEPKQVVLTGSRAARYFPGLSPQQILNKTVVYYDTINVQVVGIVADLPYASDFEGNEFLSLSTVEKATNNTDAWGSANSDTQLYLILNPNADLAQIEAQINVLSKKNSAEIMKKWGNLHRWHLLQPLADLHFGVDYKDRKNTVNKNVLLGLIGLAVFILALAIINYINMASAQVPQRAREIGIRKTLGSRQWTLIVQFLSETAALTLLAFGLAYGISQVFFATFSELIPEGIGTHENWLAIGAFLILLLVSVTVLAGLYPGWLIARLQPVAVLRGQTGYTTAEGSNRITLHKSLIIFQFFIAQFFVIGALIVNQQLQYSLRADMGFARDAVLTVSVPWKVLRTDSTFRRFTLKEELKKCPGVTDVSLGNQPASDSYSSNVHDFVGKKGKVSVNIFRKYADTNYLTLYKIPLLAGRNILPSDTVREYVVNETAAKALGFDRPQEAVGAFLKENGGQKTVPIVGVVRDFHTRSFREKIQPIALMTDRESLTTFNIKLASAQPDDWQNTIADLTKTWNGFYPNEPFDYQFYDQTMETFYKQDRQLSKVINLATLVAILISCLGLFGLATLTAHQRTKEIGVRKVLGASVAGVVALLSKDFVKLVLVAILLASPLAWWAVTKYLQSFAYRVPVSGWVFVGAGLLAILIALLTVSFQAIKAALVNPVKSLRSE